VSASWDLPPGSFLLRPALWTRPLSGGKSPRPLTDSLSHLHTHSATLTHSISHSINPREKKRQLELRLTPSAPAKRHTLFLTHIYTRILSTSTISLPINHREEKRQLELRLTPSAAAGSKPIDAQLSQELVASRVLQEAGARRLQLVESERDRVQRSLTESQVGLRKGRGREGLSA
jgi:hypothetical protein